MGILADGKGSLLSAPLSPPKLVISSSHLKVLAQFSISPPDSDKVCMCANVTVCVCVCVCEREREREGEGEREQN